MHKYFERENHAHPSCREGQEFDPYTFLRSLPTDNAEEEKKNEYKTDCALTSLAFRTRLARL